MANQGLLTARDITGAWAVMPTPSKPGSDDWRATDTVDLDEAARVVGELIRAGVNGILSMGTLGECATLTWNEKKEFMAAIVDTAAGRIPVFVGTTALNTRDSIEQTRAAHDIGADGTMLGVPMWCAPSVEVAVQFYRDVAEAVPEMNIAVYANPEAFKFEFARSFWAQVADIRQIVTAKYLGIGALTTDLALTNRSIKMLPLDMDYYAAARIDPEFMDAFWSSGAVCGPAVSTHLRDLVATARQTGDWSAASSFSDRVGMSLAPLLPHGSFREFSTYNIGLEKERMNAAGWMNAGPARPPYHIVPEPYLEGARESGRLWGELHDELNAARG